VKQLQSILKQSVPHILKQENLNTLQLFKKYGNYSQGQEPWKKYGRVNDWNIDLVPKLLMSSGELTNILVSTDVTRYLEFKQVAGSYVQQGNGPRATVAKVPSDAREALTSSLMGIFEKRRMKAFIEWVGTFSEGDTTSHKGIMPHRKGKPKTNMCRSEHEYLHHEGCVR
jgi:Rab GDP dissociation inhibitor